MDKSKPTHCYVGYKPCGCAVQATSYRHSDRMWVATQVKDMIKAGFLVQLHTWDEYVQLSPMSPDKVCTHGQIVAGDTMQGVLFGQANQ